MAASRSRAWPMATRSWATRTIRSGREIFSPARSPGTPLPSQRAVICPRARATSSDTSRRRASSRAPSQRFAAISSNRSGSLGEHRCEQTASFRQRPVVREATDEVPQILERLGRRAEDLHPALEVDLVAPDPAREEGSGRRAPHVGQEGDVVGVRAFRGAAAEPVRQLERREADPELVPERLAEAEVGRQRERRHHLRQADAIVRAGRLHGASVSPVERGRSGARRRRLCWAAAKPFDLRQGWPGPLGCAAGTSWEQLPEDRGDADWATRGKSGPMRGLFHLEPLVITTKERTPEPEVAGSNPAARAGMPREPRGRWRGHVARWHVLRGAIGLRRAVHAQEHQGGSGGPRL